MSNTRKCWIDDGVSPIYEAWVSDITDTGATIELEAGKTLPATFSVYFDENQYVGRTSRSALGTATHTLCCSQVAHLDAHYFDYAVGRVKGHAGAITPQAGQRAGVGYQIR